MGGYGWTTKLPALSCEEDRAHTRTLGANSKANYDPAPSLFSYWNINLCRLLERAGLCKPNIAWSFLVRGHGVSGGFPIRFAPWQNNKIHWRPICTFISGAVAIFYLPRIGQDDFLAGPCRWSAFRLFHGHQIGHVGQNCLQVRHSVAVCCWSGLARCFCNPVKGCKS